MLQLRILDKMILGRFVYIVSFYRLREAVSLTYSMSQMICLTVHVPLPSVQRQKQIPLNATTKYCISPVDYRIGLGYMGQGILGGGGDLLVNPMKLTNLAIIPLSCPSACHRVKPRLGGAVTLTYSEYNYIIPNHVEYQSRK
jgi:hypothetical protein